MLPKILDLKLFDAGVVAQLVEYLPRIHSPESNTENNVNGGSSIRPQAQSILRR